MSAEKWVRVPDQKPKRDIGQEQAMVCQMWKLVHANIKLDHAMHAFLHNTIDVGGGKIIQCAFDLVRQVLNPRGYVQLEHIRETKALGTTLRSEQSIWSQQGKNIGDKWDFTDSWLKSMDDWHQDKYIRLLAETVDKFCEKDPNVTEQARTMDAMYKGQDANADLDKKYSLPVINSKCEDVDVFQTLPTNDGNPPCIRRWQRKCFARDDLKEMFDQKEYETINNNQQNLEPYWRFALRVKQWNIFKRRAAKVSSSNEAPPASGPSAPPPPAYLPPPPPASLTPSPPGTSPAQPPASLPAPPPGTSPAQPPASSGIPNPYYVRPGYVERADGSMQVILHDDDALEPTYMNSFTEAGINAVTLPWIEVLKENYLSKNSKKINLVALKGLRDHLVNRDPSIRNLFDMRDSGTRTDRLNDKLRKQLHDYLKTVVVSEDLVPLIFRDAKVQEPDEIDDSSTESSMQQEYGFKVTNITCGYTEKPDVILRLGYFCEDTGLYKQRCVMCEVDGEDKTKKSSANDKEKDGGHPIKLALKLITSTSTQAVLQEETYHIRSNMSKYLHEQIQKSLLSTTNVELPEFQSFIDSLQHKDDDYKTLMTGIHWVHHLFLSHVKIAFLIHMRVVHGINMLSSDMDDPRMRDHFFFVNFDGRYLPETLIFEDKLQTQTREWLQGQLMMHTRVKIKCYHEDRPQWLEAPVMNASSKWARMKGWSARVRSLPVPNFPFEESSFMPISCCVVQRVNMANLCNIVQKASDIALKDYHKAKLLKDRENKRFTPATRRRMFPDRCFLTRAQQLARGSDVKSPWNDVQKMNLLRKRTNSAETDQLEFDFGYEKPERERDYFFTDNPDSKHWDQVDVRMYFFDKAMRDLQKSDKTDWMQEAQGMWYIQDYMDFMQMLQTLNISENTQRESKDFWDFCEDPNYQMPNCVSTADKEKAMPIPLPVNDRALQKFSILSWFFDCRDAGACGYQWENFVLEYFGANITDPKKARSKFEDFGFQDTSKITQNKYFNQEWFEICVFLEHNFRNAIAPIHYRIFEMDHAKPVNSLQGTVKTLYNQRQSLFNQRSCFEGLRFRAADGAIMPNGASFLSFQRFDPAQHSNMNLRERIFSQLHKELPELDPALLKYIRQFRIPDAELFLRMIRCPNLLALRELAVQHRHLLGGQDTASSVQPDYHIQQVLKFFPIAVQSEIHYLLKFVERDDSVWVHTPTIHDTQKIIMPQNKMRQWIRKILEVDARVQTLKTPLQFKCYMFTMPELGGASVAAFHVLKNLFFTTESMMNAGSKRSIVFVLLQMHLALEILKNSERYERGNPLAELLEIDVPELETLEADFLQWGDKKVQCTIGSSLIGWPRRDLNEYMRRVKCEPGDQQQSYSVKGTSWTRVPGKCLITTREGADEGETYEMRENERCLWLLMQYARPSPATYLIEWEDGTTVVREPERMESGVKANRDIVNLKASYKVSDGLHVYLQDDKEGAFFFEKVPPRLNITASAPFPRYIEAIISDVPGRAFIYVPKEFARELRNNYSSLHSKVFQYENATWRMVCVGARTWSWKRLLVKRLFFDALCKIMTRSSVELSLYEPLPDESSSPEEQKKYYTDVEGRHKETQEVFGSLEYKRKLLLKNHAFKQAQLVLTVHTKKHRRGQIGVVSADVYDRIPPLRRQISWITYYLENSSMQGVSCCRYILLDKRLHGKILGQHEVVALDAESVLLRRLYLYVKSPRRDTLVKFRGSLYLKYPEGYGVLSGENGVVAGHLLKHVFVQHVFATCLDTRTYDGLCNKRVRHALSEDIDEALAHFKYHTLPYHVDRNDFDWQPTDTEDAQTSSWIQNACKVPVQSFISHTFGANGESLSLENQKYMYTLPDYYSKTGESPYDEERLWQTAGNEKWTVSIQKKLTSAQNKVSAWNSLRQTNKYLAKIDQGVILNLDRSVDSEYLRSALKHIRRTMSQQPAGGLDHLDVIEDPGEDSEDSNDN
jgi:hypothetical protein